MAQWFKDNPQLAAAARTVLAAILVALLSILGYDASIVQPGLAALRGDQTISLAATGDTNFTNVVASGDLTAGDDITAGDDLTVTGAATFTEASTHSAGIVIAQDTENLVLPSVVSTNIPWTAAAGGTGTVAIVGANEKWLVHSAIVETNTNFDCTGDDTTLVVGDASDANGLINAADAQLQATFTEATGYPAGWFGLENGSNGAYTVDEGLWAVEASTVPVTITWTLDETSGETITAGAATIYLVYTRLE